MLVPPRHSPVFPPFQWKRRHSIARSGRQSLAAVFTDTPSTTRSIKVPGPDEGPTGATWTAFRRS